MAELLDGEREQLMSDDAFQTRQIPLRQLKAEHPRVSLQQAVRDGKEEYVREWLANLSGKKKKHDINAKDTFGFAAVHYAARFNRFKIMQLLLTNDADPKRKTDDGLTPLHYAARYTPVTQYTGGDDDDSAPVTIHSTSRQIMQLLVLYKVNVNVQDIYGVTPLHLACSRGNRHAVDVLLACDKIDVNIQDKQQDTPLHDACLLGDAYIVEKLLGHGADCLITNDENSTPLHPACQEGHIDIVNLILLKRFEQKSQLLAAYDNEYNYPLHLACKSGQVEIVRVLFLNQADPSATKAGDLTALHIAAREGFVNIADILLQNENLDIDIREQNLLTPLHYAAKYNQTHMIEFLLKKGADIEAQDVDSYTPVLTAVAYGQKDAMETLLTAGCCCDALDRDGKSMIFIAAEENEYEVLKSLLLGPHSSYGNPMVCSTDSNNNTPLHIACEKGNLESVKVLLRSEIKADARNEIEMTPLHRAATKGHVAVVKEMIRYGKRMKLDLIEDEDDDSNRPLHLACTNGHYNVARALLDAKADPDVRNVRHWTPMDCAAHGGWDRTIRLLLEFEADIDPKDKAGVTPLHLACQGGHLRVVQVLLENGALVSNRNEYGLNALDIGIENGHKDVAMEIIKSKQMIPALRNTSHHAGWITTPMRRLIRRMPDVAEEVFNRCAISNEDEFGKDDPNYKITMNYEFLEDFREPKPGRLTRVFTRRGKHVTNVDDGASVDDGTRDDNSSDVASKSEIAPDSQSNVGDDTVETYEGFTTTWGPRGYSRSNHCLDILVNSKSVELLKHPLVTSLLNYKWTTYGQLVYFGNLFIYFIFIIFLTAFALTALPPETNTCQAVANRNFSFENCTTTFDDASSSRLQFVAVAGAIVILFAIVKLLFEFFQLVKLSFRYFLDWVNYLEIILFSCSILFAFIYLDTCFCPAKWQWQLGALCVFLAWIDLVIFARKLPVTGIYVVMLMNIFYIFLKLAFLAALLILSFAFSFYMLFHDPQNIINNIRTPFQDPGRSIIKTMTMTTGEFEFDTIFQQTGDFKGQDDITYPVVSYILWILFLVLMPILLTNLLVGLAVDDIKGIQETAEIKRLALRVELALSVEELLPRVLRRRVIVGSREIWPNRKLNIFEKFWYEVVGSYRFDSLENIINALHPPPEPIEEVFEQNTELGKQVNEMQLQLEAMAEQNARLSDLVEAIAENKGIVIGRDEREPTPTRSIQLGDLGQRSRSPPS